MKAEELRIGNLIEVICCDKIVQVAVSGIVPDNGHYQIEFNINDESLRNKIRSYPRCVAYSQSVKPIPLTEEWLKKFGFEAKSRIQIEEGKLFAAEYTRGYIHLHFIEEWYQFPWSSPAVVVKTQIKYVHQLQNLCYALSGEELIMKP